MRILHIITGLSTGGAEMMLFKLLSASDRIKFQPCVVSLRDKSSIGAALESVGVPVYELGLQRIWSWPWACWRFFQVIRKFKPTVIQGWMYHGNLAASLIGWIIGGRIPILWNIRQSLSTDDLIKEKCLTAWVIRLGARFSGTPLHILYNSHAAIRQHELLGYNASKAMLILNGFDTENFRPEPAARAALLQELSLSKEMLLVGLVARYHPMKDHENFLRAASHILQNKKNICFIMAGRGVAPNNSALAELIKVFNLQEQVYLLGERTDMSQITAAFDVAVNSSCRGEAFSNAIGEAMACGVPCVVTDVGDSAWIVGKTGRVVLAQDSKALAKAIEELLNMKAEERIALGNMARQRIQEKFSLHSVVTQYMTLYGSCHSLKGRK